MHGLDRISIANSDQYHESGDPLHKVNAQCKSMYQVETQVLGVQFLDDWKSNRELHELEGVADTVYGYALLLLRFVMILREEEISRV